MPPRHQHTDGPRQREHLEQQRNLGLYGRRNGPTPLQRAQEEQRDRNSRNRVAQGIRRNREPAPSASEEEVSTDDLNLLSRPSAVEQKELDEAEITGQIPSELKDDTVTSQETDAYYGSNRGTNFFHEGKIDFVKDIDPIARSIVASVDVPKLAMNIKFGSVSQKRNLWDRSMQILQGNITDILLAKSEDVAKARAKKRIEATPRPMKPMVAAALRYLISSARFLIGARDPAKVLSHPEPVVHCGAFFVRKSNGKLRVILDGRYANVYFEPSHFDFSFFRLETLRNVIGNLSSNERWHALNYDLRHWFHQIPLPRYFKSYLGMILTDRLTHQRDDHRPFYAFPRSLPMGWIAAPFLAQSCAWGIVLGNSDKKGKEEFIQHSGVDLDYLARMENHGSPLPWVPLLSGGGIFVFLDNILVVTAEEGLANWWEEKIIRSCMEVKAQLKSDDDTYDALSKDFHHHVKCLKSCRVALSRTDEQVYGPSSKDLPAFDFLGVRWTYNGRSVILKDKTDQEPLPHVLADGTWSGSRREMAGVLGKLLWFRRVHGITCYDKSHCEETRALLEIYRTLAPPPTQDPDEIKKLWNEKYTVTNKTLVDGLARGWQRRARKEVTRAQPQVQEVKQNELFFAVTDASTHGDHGQGGLAAGVWYQPRLPRQTPTLKLLEQQQVIEEFKEDIALGEMYAILITVKKVVARGGKLLILATDNLSCKYWIEKGHAKRPDMQEMLNTMHELLEKSHCRLYVTYVNTKKNVADQLSRREELEQSRLDSCVELLERSFLEATSSLWKIDGSFFGATK